MSTIRWREVFLGLIVAGIGASLVSSPAYAQTPSADDEALESLLEKLGGSESVDKDKPAASSDDSASTPSTDSKAGADKTSDKDKEQPRNEPAKGPDTGVPKKKADAEQEQEKGKGDVGAEDQDLDALLEKLGETKDEPAPPERKPPHSGGPGEENKPKEPGAASDPLEGRDRDLDQRLEELTGRKRKKQSDPEEGSGPLSQIVKEMRDVEQRLSKPDTGEATRTKQKQIVKDLDTLIEQMRQSGSSGGSSMSLRMARQAGQKSGNREGDQPGSNAGGAPRTMPAKPTTQRSLAGGKDIWGHLPAELQQEMESVFKESPLSGKEELIKRYYLSVSKKKLIREE
jgi:hypothetical protein